MRNYTLENYFWETFFENKKNKEVYKWLNNDNWTIIIEGDTWWYQLTWSWAEYPNAKAEDSIKKWTKKNWLTYLYDIK